jgi:hypothetical protein
MTMTQIEKLTDEECDALCAARLFGFWQEKNDIEGVIWWGPHPSTKGESAYASVCVPHRLQGSDYRGNCLPHFSTSANADYAVLVQMQTNATRGLRIAFLDALTELWIARWQNDADALNWGEAWATYYRIGDYTKAAIEALYSE